MNKPAAPSRADTASRLAKLFDKEKFRRRATKFYRIAGPIVLAWFGLSLQRPQPVPHLGEEMSIFLY